MTDDMLWDYVDGFLSDQDKKRVDAYLSRHPEWKTRLDIVLREKREMATLPLETPAPGFSDRVMAAWATEHLAAKAAAKGDDWIVRIIVVVFGLFVLTPVVAMVVAALQLSPEQTITPAFEMPQVALPTVPLETWLDSAFLQYGLVLAFALIGLRFLDKVLRHQFAPQALA